ncbi:MAG: ATP-binding protein [Candidatus Aenigmatarchaeota archaeon]
MKLSASDVENEFFTTFNGEFDARLSEVSVASGVKTEKGTVAGAARFVCGIKAKYNKDLMRKLNEGMILAVRNFKSEKMERYTLMEISRFWPEHFGLKGVSDSLYYPIQREIIEQSVKDWDKDDASTMMIRVNAVPINYDLIVENGGLSFENGWSFPLIGEKVWILNKSTIGYLFNREVLKNLLGKEKVTLKDWQEYEEKVVDSKPEVNPRIGKIEMFLEEEIPLLVNFEDLIRYHFGVFAFTGGGKSNLVANLVRRALFHKEDIKVIIFDISCEYIVLLLDLLSKEKLAKIIVDREIEKSEELYKSIVKPKAFEKEEIKKKIVEKLDELIRSKKIKVLDLAEKKSYEGLINFLEKIKEDNSDKPYYFVFDQWLDFLHKYLEEKGKGLESIIIPEELNEIADNFDQILEKNQIKTTDRRFVPQNIPPILRGWATTLKPTQEKKENIITVDEILASLESDEKEVIILNIPDPVKIRELAITITTEILSRRKREFKISPFILFVFDEAQEFIKALDKARGEEKDCSEAIEDLSRHGRKYGLGVCISTQRIAHLNTNVLQQLHTYFIGTLPRPYDRGYVSDVCTIDRDILDKTLEFGKGEWIVSSSSATGIPNVPIFVKADNTEEVLLRFLGGNI